MLVALRIVELMVILKIIFIWYFPRFSAERMY